MVVNSNRAICLAWPPEPYLGSAHALSMTPALVTRSFREEDYDAVVQLWQDSDGVELAEGDDRASIANYLRRNPDLSRVAVDGASIVGAMLCGHDGRRGLIYHLAVRQSHRGRRLGAHLLREGLDGLKACGIQRVLILVAEDNGNGRRFWEAQGFEEISAARPFGVNLD